MASIKAIAPCNFLDILLKNYLEPFKMFKNIRQNLCLVNISNSWFLGMGVVSEIIS